MFKILSRAKEPTVTESTYTLEWTLSLDMKVFDGHFPVQPILPGVVQLGWVEECVSAWVGKSLALADILQMKFTLPVHPEERVRLTLNALTPKVDEETNQIVGYGVRFIYEVYRGQTWLNASQGRLVLCL